MGSSPAFKLSVIVSIAYQTQSKLFHLPSFQRREEIMKREWNLVHSRPCPLTAAVCCLLYVCCLLSTALIWFLTYFNVQIWFLTFQANTFLHSFLLVLSFIWLETIIMMIVMIVFCMGHMASAPERRERQNQETQRASNWKSGPGSQDFHFNFYFNNITSLVILVRNIHWIPEYALWLLLKQTIQRYIACLLLVRCSLHF